MNGLSFRLLDLPFELRMTLYEQAIGPYIQFDFFDRLDDTMVVIDPVVCRITQDDRIVKGQLGKKKEDKHEGVLRSGDIAVLARACE